MIKIVKTKFLTKNIYYLQFDRISDDRIIADILGLDFEKYKFILKNNYRALRSYDSVYFNSKKDAIQAKNWAEPYYVAYKLKDGFESEIESW